MVAFPRPRCTFCERPLVAYWLHAHPARPGQLLALPVCRVCVVEMANDPAAARKACSTVWQMRDHGGVLDTSQPWP